MSAHHLHIDSVEEGRCTWRLTCDHPFGASEWQFRLPNGLLDTDADPDECWFYSWWDALGMEIIDIDVPITDLPIPVRPGPEWTYDDGGDIVLDDSEAPDER